MLTELIVLNGEMSLEFDPLNTKYTIFLNTNESSLNLQYNLNENSNIVIENNYNLTNGSVVKLIVSDDKNIVEYFLNIYFKETEEVNKTLSDFVNLEINNKNEIPEYIGPVIASVCFILILFLFVFLFHKRRTK